MLSADEKCDEEIEQQIGAAVVEVMRKEVLETQLRANEQDKVESIQCNMAYPANAQLWCETWTIMCRGSIKARYIQVYTCERMFLRRV